MPWKPSSRFSPDQARWLQIGVMAVALVVLGGVVTLTTLQLRKGIREQITGRDAEVLYAVAMQHYAEDIEHGLGGPVASAGDPLGVMLRSAELRGVLGVRLFDAEGRFVECFPPDLLERLLDPDVLPALKQHRPVSLFYSRVGLWTLFYPDETMDFSRTVPLLEVYVPLHEESGPLAGIAQFLIEGHSISAEFARLDRRLAVQALTAFAVGGGILMVALGWAFTRLNHANRLLTERTTSLVRANQELVLAAKTSALGAVAAHLIHGLKNPLAGLQTFVNTGSATGGPIEDADWHHAVASTRRMQGMINHVISVLHEDQSGTAYTVTAAELEEMVRVRVQSLARERGVQYAAMIRSEFTLPNRIANLVALILVNLCENAVQATPKGKPVTLEMQSLRERLQFTVSDQGPGFPADVPLFMPCRSTKEQGTGVGLALCKQLANHLDATLELAQSTAEGCVFRLSLPVLRDQLTHSRHDGSTQTNIES